MCVSFHIDVYRCVFVRAWSKHQGVLDSFGSLFRLKSAIPKRCLKCKRGWNYEKSHSGHSSKSSGHSLYNFTTSVLYLGRALPTLICTGDALCVIDDTQCVITYFHWLGRFLNGKTINFGGDFWAFNQFGPFLHYGQLCIISASLVRPTVVLTVLYIEDSLRTPAVNK